VSGISITSMAIKQWLMLSVLEHSASNYKAVYTNIWEYLIELITTLFDEFFAQYIT